MEVTDQDIQNIRRIAEELFEDREYIEIEEVKDTRGDVMVRVVCTDSKNTLGTRNAFAADNLRKFHKNGYVAVAIGGDDEKHTAWFERVDSIEFGDTGPDGQYDLGDGWEARVGNGYVVIIYEGSTVAHVKREGWTIDHYTAHNVLPSKVTQSLTDVGFEESDEPLID